MVRKVNNTTLYYRGGKRVEKSAFKGMFNKYFIVEIWIICHRKITIFRTE